jgi:hypothetical protein
MTRIVKEKEHLIPELIKYHLQLAVELYYEYDATVMDIVDVCDDIRNGTDKELFVTFVQQLHMFDVTSDPNVQVFAFTENFDPALLEGIIANSVGQ